MARRYPHTARTVVKARAPLLSFPGSSTPDAASSPDPTLCAQDLEKLHEGNALAALAAPGGVSLFLQATYGDGEPSDSAAAFCRWATQLGPTGALSHLSFAVFGLGNKQYEHFNAAARKLDASLAAAGGRRVCSLGLGDDDGALEEDWASWRAALWSHLEKAFPAVAGGEVERAARRASEDVDGSAHYHKTPTESYHLHVHPQGTRLAPPHGLGGHGHGDMRHPVSGVLAARRELHASGGRSCLHVELRLPASSTSSSSGCSYESGDHLGVFAENSGELVAACCERLGMSPDAVFTLSLPSPTAALPEPFPCPCSLATALACHADLQGPPRRGALAALAQHASDPAQRKRLLHLASPAGKEDMVAYIIQPARSLMEVLQAFPSAQPPLGVFFASVAPRLAPRYYSISSSPKMHPTTVHCTIAVVRAVSPTGRLHAGVCSSWLSSLPLNSKVSLFVRTSTFRLPKSPSVPLVMVGPGTGFAPFRAFLQERAQLARQGAKLGTAQLFFGCRAPEADYIYREEMELALSAPKSQALSALHTAFSRLPGAPKVYVQHLMAQQAAAVYAAVEGGGYLYVCGDAKAMARDVHKALLELLQLQGRMSAQQAEAYVARMQQEGRYHRDVW